MLVGVGNQHRFRRKGTTTGRGPCHPSAALGVPLWQTPRGPTCGHVSRSGAKCDIGCNFAKRRQRGPTLRSSKAFRLRGSTGMQLYQSHRRAFVLLNWVAASTAGCGTFAALLELHSTMVNSRYLGSSFEFFSVLILEIVCLVSVFALQQMILERIGLSASLWFPGTLGGAFGGLIVGFCAGLTCGVVLHAFLPFDQAMLGMNNVFVFSVGATTAFGQSVGFAVPLHKRIVWMSCSGLFACLLFAGVTTNVFASFNITRIGMIIGITYGVLTGVGLAWIVPTPREILAELRYESFLRRRPLPSKVDWSFCDGISGTTPSALP